MENLTFEDLLKRDGRLAYKTKGVSMRPMLRQNRDVVVISAVQGRLKKFDVAFYKRGNNYVLHRVINVIPSGYEIRGDNTYSIERVPESAVLGVLERFQREGKTYLVTDKSYQRYARFWNAIYPLRAIYVKLRRSGGRLARKLGVRK